jgi:SRSO17 transposase
MAARLAPDNVGRMHQSLHHFVADAAWDDEAMLNRALDTVLPAMLEQGPVIAWVVDDTGFPKKGEHSVGVARQYCGQVGKQDNCRVAVSLSVTTEAASMPIAFRLYLPEVWAKDKQRRAKAGVAEEVEFQTKPQIALAEIKRAQERGVPEGIVLADAGYGNDTQFRSQLSEWKLPYVAGIQSTVTVWKPGEQAALPAKGKVLGVRRNSSNGIAPINQYRERSRAFAAGRRMGDSCLETGRQKETHFPLRRSSCKTRASRLLASRTTSRRVAPDRVAEG